MGINPEITNHRIIHTKINLKRINMIRNSPIRVKRKETIEIIKIEKATIAQAKNIQIADR